MSIAGAGAASSAVWYGVGNTKVAGGEDPTAGGSAGRPGTAAGNADETVAPANPARPPALNASTDTFLVLQGEGAPLSSGSAKPAPRAEPVVKQVGGVDVTVSGHSVDNREGVSLLRTVPGKLSYTPEILAQILSDEEGAPRLRMQETESTPVIPVPDGSSLYMPVTVWQQEGEWNHGNPLKIPIDLGEAYFRQDVESFMKLVDTERQLKEDYGDDVKLAYSHNDGGYIMLTPDDLHYDDIPSTEDGVGAILEDVRRGFRDAEGVRDVLAKYGYNV